MGFNPEGYDFSPMSLGNILMPFLCHSDNILISDSSVSPFFENMKTS